MKKSKNRYVIMDTFTGNMIDFVATEARAKKICSTYDTLDYMEMKSLDKTQITNRKEAQK